MVLRMLRARFFISSVKRASSAVGVVAVERDHLVAHLRRVRPRLLGGDLGEVAVVGGQGADALVDQVLVVEALAGGLLVDLLGGVEDAEVLGDPPQLLGDVADLALHGVDQLGLQPADRAVGDLGRDEALHRAEHELLDVGEHARLRVGVERVAEQLRELGVERDERAGERAVVLVEQAGWRSGRSRRPPRSPALRSGDSSSENERSITCDVDGDVGRPQAPAPPP